MMFEIRLKSCRVLPLLISVFVTVVGAQQYPAGEMPPFDPSQLLDYVQGEMQKITGMMGTQLGSVFEENQKMFLGMQMKMAELDQKFTATMSLLEAIQHSSMPALNQNGPPQMENPGEIPFDPSQVLNYVQGEMQKIGGLMESQLSSVMAENQKMFVQMETRIAELEQKLTSSMSMKSGKVPARARNLLTEFFQKPERTDEDLKRIGKLVLLHGLDWMDANIIQNNGHSVLVDLCRRYKRPDLLEVMKKLVSAGVDVNQKNQDGSNILITLCTEHLSNNLLEIIQWLVSIGIDVNSTDKEGDNALILLGYSYKTSNVKNMLEVVKVLLSAGIDVNRKVDGTGNALNTWCVYHRKDDLPQIVQLLVEAGVDVNGVTQTGGNNALHQLGFFYTHDNMLDIVKLLMSKGINTRLRNKEGKSPADVLQENYKNKNFYDIYKLLLNL